MNQNEGFSKSIIINCVYVKYVELNVLVVCNVSICYNKYCWNYDLKFILPKRKVVTWRRNETTLKKLNPWEKVQKVFEE